MIQLTLTLKMTTAQVVETSVTVNNSPIQDYVHLDDHFQHTYEMIPGFKPFTKLSTIIIALKVKIMVIVIIMPVFIISHNFIGK